MKLNSYTFPYEPKNWTDPRTVKLSGSVITYSSSAFFSWGLTNKGKPIILEWDIMDDAFFSQLKTIEDLNTTVVWEPCTGVFTHGSVTNGPFIPYRLLTGQTSAATGYIASVIDSTHLEVCVLTGTFQAEVVKDDCPTQKYATLSTFAVPTYTVNIKHLFGDPAETFGSFAGFKTNVKLELMIMS